MSRHSDAGRLRDALEAWEALHRLENAGQAPPNSIALRRRLQSVFDAFEVSREVTLSSRSPSGAAWCAKFPNSASTSDLISAFRVGVDAFITAMRRGSATVQVSSTKRPPERAYLMHYAWRIAQQDIAAGDVPAMAGVDIEWVHSTEAASRQAAQDMVEGYGIVARPSLTSRHTEGRAIDMTIAWSGALVIADVSGTSTTISSTPRNGENADLIEIGATYRVIKATFAGDPPHWSDDGH